MQPVELLIFSLYQEWLKHALQEGEGALLGNPIFDQHRCYMPEAMQKQKVGYSMRLMI
jgi:hypothetical protein